MHRANVLFMKTNTILMTVTMLICSTMFANAETNKVGWIKKTFSDLTWTEVKTVVESPKDISRRVKTRISYKADTQDEMKSGSKTWTDRMGDCEDYAECVAELCHDKGFDARVEVYFEDNNSKAHAVAMGNYKGRLWISSNGSFQFVSNEAEAIRVVAQEMGWKPGIVHSEAYNELMGIDDITVASGR
jgi:hypothetical protein